MNKINWISILQGWTMLWVIIGHAPLDMETMSGYSKVLYNVAYSFHMPLFFFISGYLFYMTRLVKYNYIDASWTYGRILLDKLKRLGIPFVVFTIIAMFLKTIFAGDMARPSEISIEEFLKAIIYPTEGPLMELWFVAVLFWMFALTPLWSWILKKSSRIYITIAILLTLYFTPCDVKFLCVGKVTSYTIWFFCGLLISNLNLSEFIRDKKWLFLLVGGGFWFFGLMIGLPIFATIGGIVTSIAFSMLVDAMCPQLFSSFRNYTYQIFLIGIFAQIFVKMMYRRFDQPYWFAYILCIFMGIYIPVLVSKILEKINCGPLLTIIGLKKK